VTLEAAGAPIDQGRAQGAALRDPVRAALARLRASHTWTSWQLAKRRARLGPALALGRFFPWQAERIEGIARGAGVGEAGLHLAERARVRGSASFDGRALYLCADVPPELEAQLLLRASIPDAGGFASLELGCAHWAGCLGGINSEGIAVVCADDRAHCEPSLRFLAQELLFRTRDLAAGIEHLRRRARYAGGSGTLWVAAGSEARRLELDAGELCEREAPATRAPLQATLVIDCAARVLRWQRSVDELLEGASPPTPEVRG
jgi:hypothetical protein